jgi:hypothetical protein
MTRFAVQLRQAQGGPSWPHKIKYSNVYFCEAANAPAAAEMGRQIWLHLRQCHRVLCFCYQIYATDLVKNTTNYVIEPITPGEQRGTVGNSTPGEAYNPHVCQRVDLLIGASRPSRKFHRGGFIEADVEDGGLALIGTFQSAFSTAYAAIDADSSINIVDVDGQIHIGTSVLGLTIKKLSKMSHTDVPTGPAFG